MEKRINKTKGFTLVELIIVTAVLLFVVATAISIFFTIFQHQKRILAEQELLNQVSFTLEHMSKALRMAGKDTDGSCLGSIGYNYQLTHQDTTTGTYLGVKFINQSENSICQEFYLDNITDPLNAVIKEKKNGLPADGIALTSDRLVINSLRFGINGGSGLNGETSFSSVEDGVQPRITIYLDIKAKGDIDQPIKKIQTTISQRNINVSGETITDGVICSPTVPCGTDGLDGIPYCIAGFNNVYQNYIQWTCSDNGTVCSSSTTPMVVETCAEGQICSSGACILDPCTTEICDGIDNDCDASVDEGGVCTLKTYYCDADNDTYKKSTASGTCSTYNCVPAGCSETQGTDCNDSNTNVNPGATEICNGINDNCNGTTDEAWGNCASGQECSGGACVDVYTCYDSGSNIYTVEQVRITRNGAVVQPIYWDQCDSSPVKKLCQGSCNASQDSVIWTCILCPYGHTPCSYGACKP